MQLDADCLQAGSVAELSWLAMLFGSYDDTHDQLSQQAKNQNNGSEPIG